MVKLTRIYTRGGDNGLTSLGDGSRVSKSDHRVEAYGSVDELNAYLGVAMLSLGEQAKDEILRIQNDLFDLGADLCVPEDPARDGPQLRVAAPQVQWLEARIDDMNRNLRELKSFVLPGGSSASAHLHVARTIARRAERNVVQLASNLGINPVAVQYINRLSDYLFVLARIANDCGAGDILWVPGKDRTGWSEHVKSSKSTDAQL